MIEVNEVRVFPGCANGLRQGSVVVVLTPSGGAETGSEEGLTREDTGETLVAALADSLPEYYRDSVPGGIRGDAPLAERAAVQVGWLAQGFQEAAGVPATEAVQVRRLASKQRPGVDGDGNCRWLLVIPTLIPKELAGVVQWLIALRQEYDADPGEFRLSEERALQCQRITDHLRSLTPGGANQPRLLRAASRMDVPVERITPRHLQYGWGRRARLLHGNLTDATPSMGVDIARDKSVTNRVLRAARIPVPEQREVRDVDAALAAAETLGYPVVVKPADLDGGVGAEARLECGARVVRAFRAAAEHSRRVLVEKQVEGKEYRLTVLNGRLLWAHERVPAEVTGDGVSALHELIEQENVRRRRLLARDPEALRPIEPAEEDMEELATQGIFLDTVPPKGQSVRLQRIPNGLYGGSGEAVMDVVHADNRTLAERVAALLRMDLVALDLLMPDIALSWRQVGGAVTDVNALPQISNLTHGRLHDYVLAGLVPGDGRIPIVVLIGDPARMQWLASLVDALRLKGYCPGVSHPAGLEIDGRPMDGSRESTFDDVRALELDPRVGVILVVCDDDELLRTGFPFDRFDILVHVGGDVESANQYQMLGLLIQSCQHLVMRAKHGAPHQGSLEKFFRVSSAKSRALPDDVADVIAQLMQAIEDADAGHSRRRDVKDSR